MFSRRKHAIIKRGIYDLKGWQTALNRSARRQLQLATLLLIGLVTGVAALASVTSNAGATGEKIAMGMPFDGNWAFNVPTTASCGTGDTQTAHPSCHATNGTDLLGYHWATDYYTGDGTAVKLYGRTESGSTVTFSSVTAGGSCGDSVTVTAKVNGTSVGQMYITHLNNAVLSSNIPNDSSIGSVKNECFGVDHVHFSYKNTGSNYACYVNFSIPNGNTAGIAKKYGDDIGVVGAARTGTHAECDSSDFPSSTPPDTDNDGILNASDFCPTVYAPTTRNGCPKSDFNRDGRADITALYRMDQPAANTPFKWEWQGKADSSTTANGWLWQPPASEPGWDANKIIQAGTGDFNNDKKQDTATFYAHGNGMIDMNIWYGDGTGNPINSTRENVWHADTGWYGDRLIPAGIGDFNNDGKDDIAAFYRYDNLNVSLYVWWGVQVASGPQQVSGPFTKWSGSGWDGNLMLPAGVTDISGGSDHKLEIVSFYRHASGQLDINAFTAPNNSTDNFTQSTPRSYTAAAGWDSSRLISAGAGDFNKDGRGDLVAFYRRDTSVTLDMWKGQTDGSFAEHSEPWTGSDWEGARMLPTGVSDYNGDGKLDIAGFYRRDNGAMDINIWYDQYGDTATYAPNYAFLYLTGSGWDGYRLNPIKW